ncbi:hypothetical protein [Sorangium sp. So ce363]|uniref:hypothetical protein n=1 Tax=Sorangium sp. So ce363 TaxID=3133304 RepID=UPI003F5DF566
MTDPERLLDQKGSALRTTLLRAALDESPPSGLTRRMLVAVGVGAAVAGTGGAAVAGTGSAGVAGGAAAAGGAVVAGGATAGTGGAVAAGGAAAGTGGAAAGTGGAAAGTGGAVVAGGATAGAGGAAAAGASVALKVAGVAGGSGILSALGIGALAGVLTLGVAEWTHVDAPMPARRAQEASSAPAALAAPRAPGAAEAELHERVSEERTDDAPLMAAPAATAPAATAAISPRARERNAPTLASELALLDTARRALRRGDPAAALALLARHAREFPSAQLSDEAAAIRVEALASKGDRAGAHAAARRFLEAHPGSPHADRVESAAGLDTSKGAVQRRNGPAD